MLKTFHKGGIHPVENKFSAGREIRVLPPPEVVYIPLSQHLGAPAKLIIDRGEKVKTGQLVAKSTGFVSVNIHSSVSGTVRKIDQVQDGSGYKRTAILIETCEDEWQPGIDLSPDINTDIQYSPEEIIRKTLYAGIVGLGGAAFPSHVKLSIPRGKHARALIINGAECEPYLTSDHRLMLEKGKELIIGIKLLMRALRAETAMIGIENNKQDAIRHLEELAGKEEGISVYPLKVKYPQGGEKQLIKALTKMEVPSGGLPIDIGVVVHNVGTAFAVYEALQKNKPLIERVVTVTGKSLKNPSNFLVRIGTPVINLIEAAGGLPADTGKVISGGPMMGKALSTFDVPVVKGTSGIVILPESESKRRHVKVCIRCTKCVAVCPQGLEPYLLMSLAQNEYPDELEMNKVMDCIECGACSYICPSGRPLLDYIRLGKAKVGQIIRTRKN
ncbi:MAG: electron transport complex subunit RsxC [Bacteroidales bacterium]|nr:MAG: electron transport complex subunit RsxC [Bacteroidales bacterium]